MPTRDPPRFSLRFLLLIVAACAPPLALFRADAVLGVALGLVIAGLLWAWIGSRMMRPAAMWGGVLLVVAVAAVIGLFIRADLPSVYWSGTSKLEVRVLVLDASTLARIRGATVEVIHGPTSPLEGSRQIDVNREFQIDAPDGRAALLTTDDTGFVRFTHAFFASGADKPFSSSGYVDTSDAWLRVAAPG